MGVDVLCKASQFLPRILIECCLILFWVITLATLLVIGIVSCSLLHGRQFMILLLGSPILHNNK